ncbi:MAG: hypothetical protein JOZ41_06135, partial [Chloroflexi bacterium]|nr:hypothetical protein [Chloroflexota bacterium]
MEEKQLDELTKQLAKPVPRRTVLRAAIATCLGGMAAMANLGRSSAAESPTCHGVGASCLPYGQFTAACCTGYCTSQGKCGCPGGQIPCTAGGVESCVATCPAGSGQVLNSATCTCQCTTGSRLCTNTAGTTACVPACTGG